MGTVWEFLVTDPESRHHKEARRTASVLSSVLIPKATEARYRRNGRKRVLRLQRTLGPVGEKVLWFCRALGWGSVGVDEKGKGDQEGRTSSGQSNRGEEPEFCSS